MTRVVGSIDADGNSLSRTLQALNEFGRDGWQLAGTELIAEQGVFRATYFLKRSVEQASGSWAVRV